MTDDRLGAVFAALSAPIRRDIVARLGPGPLTAGEISRGYEVSAPAISRHLRVLEEAGIVSRTARAQWRTVALRPGALDEASEWIARQRDYWESRLDALERHLENGEGP